jgi:hypothetical protein
MDASIFLVATALRTGLPAALNAASMRTPMPPAKYPP